jgi:nucleoside-diphosphate-sugar epimerase
MPPIVFENPGTYPDGSRQKTAFARGTVYFRHGAKSEPAIQDDMRNSFERLLSRRQRGILKDVRRIVTAPSTHIVQLVPVRNKLEDPPSGSRIRVVEAADAPSGRLYSVDDTHPYRLKDVIAMVNKRLEGRVRINQHDMRCVRLVFGIDEKKPAYYHRPRFSSPQYSDAYVDWLVESYVGDPEWFEKARQRFAKM